MIWKTQKAQGRIQGGLGGGIDLFAELPWEKDINFHLSMDWSSLFFPWMFGNFIYEFIHF